MKHPFHALLFGCALAASTPAPGDAATVTRVDAAAAKDLVPAEVFIGGRVDVAPHARMPGATGRSGTDWTWQWPGIYFETAFAGREAVFEVGEGATILHVQVAGSTTTLARPAPGLYRVSGLADRPHILRISTATENQAGPNRFGGIFLTGGSQALQPPLRERRIEFIGDSHTVGYGNRSAKRDCSSEEVWATTDNTLAYGPLLAARYGAHYRINAISGRGVVRNYGGAGGDTLPQAWPFVLFDHSVRDDDREWQPQLVVIALGTNDFSTPLGEGERWKDRAALTADYERSYAAFVRSLRGRWPDAHFLLWSTGLHDGEIRAAVQRVVARLRATGETQAEHVPVDGLEMDGCHWHPSLADHARIAAALRQRIDALPGLDWDDGDHPIGAPGH
jgi:lysophospholipase L1-like esterase